MRVLILASACVLALAACDKKPEEAAKPAADAAPAMAGHDMAGMNDTMKAADVADDTSTTPTADNFTFHTYPNKTETVRLTVPEGVWSAKQPLSDLVAISSESDETMADGSKQHVYKIGTKTSGNAVVVFERRSAAGTDGPVLETRTINFMIH